MEECKKDDACMKTLAQHENDVLSAARARAEAFNRRIEEEVKRRRDERELNQIRYRISYLENEFNVFNRARHQPVFHHLIRELEFKLAQGVSEPVKTKALEVAKDLLNGSEIESRFIDERGEMACSVELILAFMRPVEYHIRRKMVLKPM
jgi:hypothetical protein